jgi:hypothetical protein
VSGRSGPALRHLAPDCRQQSAKHAKDVEKRHLERLRRACDRPIICPAFEDAFRTGQRFGHAACGTVSSAFHVGGGSVTVCPARRPG